MNPRRQTDPARRPVLAAPPEARRRHDQRRELAARIRVWVLAKGKKRATIWTGTEGCAVIVAPISQRAKIPLRSHMPAKPFRIVELPPDPPSAAKLARSHHLSQHDRAMITDFVISVRSSKSKSNGKAAHVTRISSSKRAARKK